MNKCLILAVQMFLLVLGNVALAGDPPLKDYLDHPAYPDDFWETSTPGKEGLDERLLQEALTYIADNELEVHSFSIIKNGKLVFDRYGLEKGTGEARQRTPDDIHELHSTTKTFLSALLGVAIEEGHIPGVEAKVMNYFRDDNIANPGPEKAALTLEHLLLMQSGLEYAEGQDDPLFTLDEMPVSARAFLNRPMASAPGSGWNYSSGNSQILAEVLRKATGKTPLEYAVDKLFSPLGISAITWHQDKSGTHYGGWGLFLRPRDVARFGYLYLRNGKWNGKQLVPKDWIETSTAGRVGTHWAIGRYGYHTWAPVFGGFGAMGYLGQDMFIFPQHDLIVIFTANLPPEKADQLTMAITDRFVLKGLREGKRP